MYSCHSLIGRGENSTNLYGWVDQPNFRGTFDIIFSCLLVILICTWTVLHVNLPGRNDSDLTTCLRKARWAVLATFAPEVVTLFAACQWSSARSNVEVMQALGVINWTNVHGFYANAGGFILHSPDMPPFPINADAIYYLVRERYLEPPSITKEEIRDRSKADRFAKGMAVVQSTWMIAQCIARPLQSLRITPLELVTVAFTTCTLASYFFWMEKPLGVEVPSALTTSSSIREILQNAGNAARLPYVDTPMDFVCGSGRQHGLGAWGRRQYFKTFGSLQVRPIERIPDDYTPPPQSVQLALLTWVLSLLHGAIHVAGWNFPFPTPVEQYLWRSASIAMIVILFAWGIVEVLAVKSVLNMTISLLGIWEKPATSEGYFRRWGLDLPATVCAIVYLLARALLLVLSATSLRLMPGSVYETVNWTNYIPHF